MPGERKLVPWREDPDANVAVACRGKDEHRLGEADLERDPLHRVVVEPAGVGEHRELVAGQRHVREDVREDEAVGAHRRRQPRVGFDGGAFPVTVVRNPLFTTTRLPAARTVTDPERHRHGRRLRAGLRTGRDHPRRSTRGRGRVRRRDGVRPLRLGSALGRNRDGAVARA